MSWGRGERRCVSGGGGYSLIAIRVENLSKLYHIGRAQQRHDTLHDALVGGLRAPLR